MSNTESILDTLSTQRVFRVFIPDITLAEAQHNDPYVLKIVLPAGSHFFGVPQIASPLAGMGMLAGTPQVSYAFLCDPDETETRNVYITAVFSERAFPWHGVVKASPELSQRPGGGLDFEYPQGAFCIPLGITSHNGVPLLHVRVDVHVADYDRFEDELRSAGYRIVAAKPYTQAESLIELFKAHAQKGGASPSNASEVGS